MNPTPPKTTTQATGAVIAAIKETETGERRVALVPESVTRLEAAGAHVLVEAGAGARAWFPDEGYAKAGAAVVHDAEAVDRADVVATVGVLPADRLARMRSGQVVIGMLRPLTEPAVARELADRGVTAVSLDGLPRTLSRAQSMDALSSQANVAGYKAVLVAADAFGRFFPLLMTAAGTAKPADVLVIGAGVAGLQAMGTARRLGAVVTGYDVRAETRSEIESVGARFLELDSIGSASGEGGYARALSAAEERAQQEELNSHLAHFDVVITTAQVPGRQPPRLVTAAGTKQMRAGSVIVDLGASAFGGNVEGSIPDRSVVIDGSVTIIGAANLAAQVPTSASVAYSHNVVALMVHLLHDGVVSIDLSDEIQAGVVITHGGQVVNQSVKKLVDQLPRIGAGT